MPTRTELTGLIAAIALMAAACGADPGSSGAEAVATTAASTPTTTVAPEPAVTTTSAAPATTTTALATTTTSAPAPEFKGDGSGLNYMLEAGASLRFEGSMAMDMDFEFVGFDGVPDAPSGPIETKFAASVVVVFDVEDGPDPGTFLVTQTVEVVELTDFSFTGDGETIDIDEVDDFSEYLGGGEDLFGPPLQFVVTADGEVIGGGAGGDAGSALDAFGGAGAGLGSQQLWGPSVPTRDLSVGQSWSVSHSEELAPGDELTVTSTSTVVAVDEIDGHEVFVIETVVETSGASFSFGDIDAGEEELTPEEQAMIAFFDIDMSVEPSTTTTTAWYDPDSGIVRRHVGESSLGFSMGFAGLPDTDGPVTMIMALAVSFETAISET